MRKWIFSLLFLLMVGGVPRGEWTNERGKNDMAIEWGLKTLTASSSANPYCYTYPDDPSSQSYLSTISFSAVFEEIGNESNTITKSKSFFTSGLTYSSTSTPQTYENAAFSLNWSISFDFTDTVTGDTYIGSTTKSISVIVSTNQLVSATVSSNSTHKTAYKVGEYINLSGLKLNETFTAGTRTDVDYVTQIDSNGYRLNLYRDTLSWIGNSDYDGSQQFSLTNVGSSYISVNWQPQDGYGSLVHLHLSVTVTQTIRSFSITKQPTKVAYNDGEAFDATGMEITRFYEYFILDTITITSTGDLISKGFTIKWSINDETISSPYTMVYGRNDLYLVYNSATYTDSLDVNSSNEIDISVARSLDHIAVKTTPSFSFAVGQPYNSSGLEINAFYSNATSTPVEVSGFTTYPANGYVITQSNYDQQQAGTPFTVTVYYSENGIEKSTTYTVTLVQAVVLDHIDINGTLSTHKTTFDIGDTLDISGLIITATYSNATTVDIQSGFTVTPSSGYKFRASDIGSKTITITYQVNDVIKQTTYSVTVNGYVKYIAITTAPTGNQYYGSYLNKTGMVVKKYWSDDLTSETTTDYTTNYDSVAFSALGTTLVSVVYSGVDYVGAIPNTSMSVTVLKPTTLSSMVATLDQLSYSVGDTLDLSDIECTLSWAVEHGTAYTEVIYGNNANLLVSVDSGAYGANPSTYTFGAVRTSVLNTELNLSFKYNGTSVVDDLDFTVNGYYEMVLVALDTAKYFKVNSTFTYGTLQVYLKSTLGYVSLVSGDFSLSSPNMSSVGTKTVTVTWNDGNYTSNIVGTYSIIVYGNLLTLTLVDLNTNYTLGSAFSDNELTVTANYDGGYSKVVEDYTIDPEDGDYLDTAGNITVTVSYTDTQTASNTYTIVVSVISDGKLYYYDETTKAETLFGSPLADDDGKLFNYTQTLDESDGTAKMVILNNIRKPLAKYTVCYQKDTDTWWVVKKDSSVFVNGNRARSDYLGYRHSVELVEAFNYLSRFVLPTRAFYQYRYTYAEMLGELIKSARITCNVSENKYVDLDQPNKFFSFDGLLLSTAVRQIASALASVPKLRFSLSGGTLGTPYLYFLPKSGLSNTPIDISILNTSTDTAFEQIDGNEKHATRIVSKINNAQSSELCVYPKGFGVPATDDQNANAVYSNLTVKLPTNVSKLQYVLIMPFMEVSYKINNGAKTTSWTGFYEEALLDSVANTLYDLIPDLSFRSDVINLLSALVVPSIPNQNDNSVDNYTFFGEAGLSDKVGRMFLKPYAYYSLMNDTLLKKNCIWWKQGTNEVGGFDWLSSNVTSRFGIYMPNKTINVTYNGDPYVFTFAFPSIGTMTKAQFYRFRVGYYPAADIVITKDNESVADVSAIYNQNGKLVDSNAASKQVEVYAKDCVSENIVRRAEYANFTDIMRIGTLVSDGGQLCVTKQVSVDFYKDWFSVEYMFSENTASASDMITADSNIVVFATPQENTVKRVQSYKDYVEFNLDGDENHNDTPYLLISKVFANIGSETKHGVDLDYQCLVKAEYLGKKLSKTLPTTTEKYFSVGSFEYDLDKGKLLYLDFMDNNIVGIQISDEATVDLTVGYSNPQVPYSYVDSDGELTSLQILFCQSITGETNTPILSEYPQIPSTLFETKLSGEDYDIIIEEATYYKDGYEIPVFEYELQMGEANGFVFGSDLLKYFAVPSGLTGHLAMIFSDIYVSSDNAEAIFNKTTSGSRITATLTLSGENVLNAAMSGNATNLLNKNVGFYLYWAKADGSIESHLLFGINRCEVSATTSLAIHINNYRIYGI